MRDELVVVFARAPERGRVKTRLAASVGDDLALALYRWIAERVIGGLNTATGGWDLRVAATPEVEAVARWLPEVSDIRPQRGADLGERMQHALAEGLDEGRARVVIVGTDCPAVDARRVGEAFDALRSSDVVLGPALDGGYYLIGATRAVPVFDHVPWSTDAVMECTRQRLREHAIPWRELAPEGDVDRAEDLGVLVGLPGNPLER